LFCLCEMDKRFVLFHYTMNVISTMVEPLEGEPRAIKAQATRNNWVVSSKAEGCFHAWTRYGESHLQNQELWRREKSAFLSSNKYEVAVLTITFLPNWSV
jgi:hypothetical protein